MNPWDPDDQKPGEPETPREPPELWSHIPNLESFLQDLYIRSTGLSVEPTSAQFSALSQRVSAISSLLVIASATSQKVSVAIAVETNNRISADNILSNAISVVSQAISILSQATSVTNAALSVRIDTQSQAISVLSQAVSILSQGLSMVSNAASNALSVANAASNAVSILSQSLSVQAVALSIRIDTQSQSISVLSQQVSVLSNLHSALSQAVSILSQQVSVLSQNLSVVSAEVTVASKFNFTFNGDFEIFGSGTAAIATGWTAAGAGASYAKNTTAGQFKFGTAALQITPGVGATGQAFQDIDLISGFNPAARWQGKKVSIGMWVRATAAAQARIRIDDGVGNTASADHTGTSAFVFLTATRTLDAAATRVRIIAEVSAAGAAAQFDGAILVVGSAVADFIPSGWRGRKAIIGFGNNNVISQGVTVFLNGPHGPDIVDTGSFRVPFKGVARNFQNAAEGTTPVGESFVYTLRRNLVDSTPTSTTTFPFSFSSDRVHEVQFDIEDMISIKLVTSAVAGAARHSSTLEYEEIP